VPLGALRSLLHRQIWRRLPYRWRRALLFGFTAYAAPRPDPDAAAATPIIVVGALRTASGLGESARLCHDALLAGGFPVYGVDLTAPLQQAVDHLDFTFRDGAAMVGPGTLIIHVNGPLMPLAMLLLKAGLIRGKRVVGYWAWELPQVPREWARGAPFVHAIWAPSTFAARAFSTISDGRPVHVLPHPVADTRPSPESTPARARPFTMLTMFNMASSLARKNPCAAIEAFGRAFADDPDARLIVKCTNGDAYPEGLAAIARVIGGATNILFIDRVMSRIELDGLYAEADAFVSLHRSEGFGLTIAEAMLRGLPVIATNWSGNVDFLDDATGIPIGYALTHANDPQGTYDHPSMEWANPDVDAAARAMLRLRDSPDLRRRLGGLAREVAHRALSRAQYCQNVAEALGLKKVASPSGD
jgi:glycosyltransferase involved in cell wall biosynthesis